VEDTEGEDVASPSGKNAKLRAQPTKKKKQVSLRARLCVTSDIQGRKACTMSLLHPEESGRVI